MRLGMESLNTSMSGGRAQNYERDCPNSALIAFVSLPLLLISLKNRTCSEGALLGQRREEGGDPGAHLESDRGFPGAARRHRLQRRAE